MIAKEYTVVLPVPPMWVVDTIGVVVGVLIAGVVIFLVLRNIDKRK